MKATSSGMLPPRRLRPGDRIGIVAPSSPVEKEELERGVAVLTARGYRAVVGPHVLATAADCNYLAGEDADRLDDLHTLFADPSIHAVFAARGGYGAMRLFPSLDVELLRANPKPFVGYSDITSLHLAFTQAGGFITFHGPNVGALPRLTEASHDTFWRLLEDPSPLGRLPTGNAELTCLVPGVVDGELAGGNLCLLAHACGSRFAPDLTGKIVLIEDVGEAIYRSDRDLTQLRNCGALQSAAGFVVGTITGWRKQESDPPVNSPATLWKRLLADLGRPTLYGFPFGHEPNPLTLPLGVRARLDSTHGSLTLLDAATR